MGEPADPPFTLAVRAALNPTRTAAESFVLRDHVGASPLPVESADAATVALRKPLGGVPIVALRVGAVILASVAVRPWPRSKLASNAIRGQDAGEVESIARLI